MKAIFLCFIMIATHLLNSYVVTEGITNTLEFFTCGLNKEKQFLFRKIMKDSVTHPFPLQVCKCFKWQDDD